MNKFSCVYYVPRVWLQVNYVQDKWNRTMIESAWCGIPFDKPDISSQLLMVISSCIFFVAPMTLILILYLRIALVLHRSSRNRSLRRCCASHHSPNLASSASVAYAANNHQVQTGNVVLPSTTMPTPTAAGSTGKRCQAERAHIQSRRAVIRMLGNLFSKPRASAAQLVSTLLSNYWVIKISFGRTS